MAKILIVDDDPQLRRSFEKLLTQEDHTVQTAATAEAGLDIIGESPPDLVIMDVRLPGMNGLEGSRAMRTVEPKLPIIIMTAYGTTETAIQATKEGAFDYVLKPFRSLELEARIRNILSRSPKRAEDLTNEEQVPERLSVHIGNDTYLVPLDQIYYFEASGKYAYAHTRNRRFLTNFSIGEVEERLRRNGKFKRIHRSFMVNTDCVFKITRDERKRMLIVIADENGTEIRVSDSYAGSLKQVLGI